MRTLRNPILLIIAALLAMTMPSYAAGQYDGNWVIDAPPAGGTGQSIPTGCAALRIPFKVTDNQISGSLERVPYEGQPSPGGVQPGQGPNATPITGSVQPDGTLSARWQNFHATGKLLGNEAVVTWNGECGMRVATGFRMTPSEAAGTTLPPTTGLAAYNGHWVIEAPSAGGTGQSVPTGCEAVTIPFTVADGRISGSLRRLIYGTGSVQAGQGPGASPITGTVEPDGTLSAQWQNFRATGTLAGNAATVEWSGECGLRVAVGGRVSTSEASGSTAPPASNANPGTPPPGTAYEAPWGGGRKGVVH